MKKALLVLMLAGSANATNLTVEVKTNAYPAAGQIGNSVPIACQHIVKITNPTTVNEFPMINFQLCAEGQKCQTVRYQQVVNNGTYNKEYKTVIYSIYRNSGHYKLTCLTSVDGFASQESVNDISIT